MRHRLRAREECGEWLFRPDLEAHGVMVPAASRHPGRVRSAARLVPAPVRRAARAAAAEAAVFLLVSAFLAAVAVHTAAQLTPPPVPASEQVCGSSSLDGPSSPPGGAVSVPAGDNSGVNFTTPDTTYWFAPGTHTIGSGPFNSIQPGNGAVFEGAPGAILSGQGLNDFAIASNATGVTVEYLTIEDFTPPGSQGAVNQNGSPDWTVSADTIQDNVPGAAMMVGTGDMITGNCLTENGQYGFNAYTAQDVSPVTGGPSGITMTGNEISYNDTCNWEDVSPWPYPAPPSGCTGAGQATGCGCSGAGKFWEADQGTFADNYVHDNYAVGAWWDTNDNGWLISGNYFSGNFAEAVIYEISYNADITSNVFVRNASLIGTYNPGGPVPALYISESGSDSRVPGAYGTQFSITGNSFYDNWGGVTLWENANRYCSSSANTSGSACTLVDPAVANLTTCQAVPAPVPPSRAAGGTRQPPWRRGQPRGGTITGQAFNTLLFQPPYISDCRWKTQNVLVSQNLFDFSPADLGSSCTLADWCGFNGLFSEYGSYPPYTAYYVPQDITFSQDDVFAGNTYCGPWNWDVYVLGNVSDFASWQGSPYGQDAGSTLNGAGCSAPPPVTPRPGMQNRPVVIPVRTGRR
jgi:hypothetical protein